jgi:hypothetical protein
MPALPAVPKVIRVTLPFKLPTDPNALSRFFVEYSGTAPTPIQLQTFCDAVATAEATEFGPLMSGLYTMQAVQAEDLSSSSSAVAGGSIANAGSRAGGSLAPGTALIIEFLIARRYRGGKPKVFLPLGVSADVTAAGVWNTAFAASASAGWAAFIASVVAAGWTAAGTLEQVSVSYYAGNTPVQNPITHRWRNVPTLRGTPIIDPVVAVRYEAGLGSQRRRNAV